MIPEERKEGRLKSFKVSKTYSRCLRSSLPQAEEECCDVRICWSNGVIHWLQLVQVASDVRSVSLVSRTGS